MEIGETVTLRVRAIANGFLVTEAKAREYQSGESEPLFYPTIEGVEAELVFRLRAGMKIDVKEGNF